MCVPSRGRGLPLRLHGVWDSWGIVFDPIPFVCTDGRRKVRCWAALDALGRVSGMSALQSLSDPELADLFARWVERFAEIASDKFDAGKLQPDGTVKVTAGDLTEERFPAGLPPPTPAQMRTGAVPR